MNKNTKTLFTIKSDEENEVSTWIFFEEEGDNKAIPIDAVIEIFRKNILKIGSDERNGIKSIWFLTPLSWKEAEEFVSLLNSKYKSNFFVENII